MVTSLFKASSLMEDLERAYLGAQAKWTGCDWATASGKGTLDLNGLRSSQAFLLARATAGAEAAQWHAAATWLERIEREARDAETAAAHALRLARAGRFLEALPHAQRACVLEASYHSAPNWQPFRELLEAAVRYDRADSETL